MKRLAIVALGVIVGFSVFSARAMQTAIVNGLMPLATALYATWLSHEWPSPMFWASALAGSVLVIAFALRSGGCTLRAGDLLILIAVAIGALGYAEGGRLARQFGGWQVICWALVLSSPFLLPVVSWLAWMQHLHHPEPLPLKTWLAFGYITLFSQFIGFFAWYAGLAMDGIARVGQTQLLQIFFTMAFSVMFFGEHVGYVAWFYAIAVIVAVALGKLAAVREI